MNMQTFVSNPKKPVPLSYEVGSLAYPSPGIQTVGGSVNFKICYGNRGPLAASNVPIHVVLSTDPTLSTNDVPIVNNTWSFSSMAPYSHGCSVINMTVPNVVSGVYYIMYRIGSASNSTGVVVVNNRLRVL